jgi:hypothetical protein
MFVQPVPEALDKWTKLRLMLCVMCVDDVGFELFVCAGDRLSMI